MDLKQEKILIYMNTNHQKESLVVYNSLIEEFNPYKIIGNREKFKVGQILRGCVNMLSELLISPMTSTLNFHNSEGNKTEKILAAFLNGEVKASAYVGLEHEIPHLKSYIQFINMCANNREHCTLWDLERFHNIIEEPMARCRSIWLNSDGCFDSPLEENEILELLVNDRKKHDVVIGRIKGSMKQNEATKKDLPEGLRKILDQYNEIGMLGNYTSYYEIKTVIDLLSACLQEVFKHNKCVALCEHCGRLFIPPHRKDTKYCDFPSPENPERNCKEQVRIEKQLQRDNAKESAKMHKSIRTMLSNKYGETSDELCKFIVDSSERRNLIKEGKLAEDEYVEWLKTFFVRKYKK